MRDGVREGVEGVVVVLVEMEEDEVKGLTLVDHRLPEAHLVEVVTMIAVANLLADVIRARAHRATSMEKGNLVAEDAVAVEDWMMMMDVVEFHSVLGRERREGRQKSNRGGAR